MNWFRIGFFMQLAKWFSVLSLLGLSSNTFAENSHLEAGKEFSSVRAIDTSPADETFSFPLEKVDEVALSEAIDELFPKVTNPTGELNS